MSATISVDMIYAEQDLLHTYSTSFLYRGQFLHTARKLCSEGHDAHLNTVHHFFNVINFLHSALENTNQTKGRIVLGNVFNAVFLVAMVYYHPCAVYVKNDALLVALHMHLKDFIHDINFVGRPRCLGTFWFEVHSCAFPLLIKPVTVILLQQGHSHQRGGSFWFLSSSHFRQ